MRRLLLAATAALLLATAGCNLSLDPTNVTGTVTSHDVRYNPATKVNNYYLTIAGTEYRVNYDTYNHCRDGQQYPKCK
jgi:hypothetical protein